MAEKTPAPEPPQASRAGRNLPVALGVALVLAAIVIPTVLLFRWTFVAIILAAVIASIWELRCTLASAAGITISWIPIMVGAAATLILAWPYGYLAQVVGICLTALACMIWRLPGGQVGYLKDLSASVFVVIYVVFFASFATLIVSPPDGSTGCSRSSSWWCVRIRVGMRPVFCSGNIRWRRRSRPRNRGKVSRARC